MSLHNQSRRLWIMSSLLSHWRHWCLWLVQWKKKMALNLNWLKIKRKERWRSKRCWKHKRKLDRLKNKYFKKLNKKKRKWKYKKRKRLLIIKFKSNKYQNRLYREQVVSGTIIPITGKKNLWQNGAKIPWRPFLAHSTSNMKKQHWELPK